MKTIFSNPILTVLAVLVFLSSSLKAQHDVDINVLGIFYKNLQIDYEYVVNDQTGVGLSLMYGQNTLDMDIPSGVDYSAFEIVPEFNFYPIPSQGVDKLFITVYMKYKSAKWEDMSYMVNAEEKYYDLTYGGVGIGFQLGYKLLFRSNFFLQASAGMGRYIFTDWDDTGDKKFKLSESENNEYRDDFIYEWDVRFALGLGYRFGGNAAK